MRGSALPVTGAMPVTARHVHACLETDHDGERARQHTTEHVGRVAADAHSREDEETEEDDDEDRTDEAELLAHDGIDEVGVGIRQVEVLLAGKPMPVPNTPPLPKA